MEIKQELGGFSALQEYFSHFESMEAKTQYLPEKQ